MSTEQFQPLFQNCLYVREGYPCRLLPGARSYYHSLGREFADRADCTCTVRLSFMTEARELSFSSEVVSFCRSRNVVDVFEDGLLTGSVRLADMQSRAEFHFRRQLPGRARVDLWVPNTCGLRLLEAGFGDWAPAPVPERRLLLLGDSIMQGIDSYHPANAVANRLALYWDAQCVNQSVGGAQFFPETLEPLPYRPDRILIALGGNDAFHPAPDREERISGYFKKVRALYPDVPIAALTPVWTMRLAGDPALQREFEAVAMAIRRECLRYRIPVLDGMRLLPRQAGYFNEDGIHPNDEGFLVYALHLTRVLSWDAWNEVM